MIRQVVAIAFLICSSSKVVAACSDVFPTGVASASATSTITLNNGADVLNTPGNQIVTQNLVQGDASNCGTVACTASNTLAQQTTDFNAFNGGSNINLGFKQKSSINAGHFGSVFLDNESRLTLRAGGDYYFDGDFEMDFQAEVRINGSGTTRVFISGDLIVNNEGEVNTQGNNAYLYLYVRGSSTFDFAVEAEAVLYSIGDVFVDNNVDFTGAITSEGDIEVDFGADITYDAGDIAAMDFGGDCSVTASIDNFDIDLGSGTASVCSAITVTITARNDSNVTITDYTETVTISTSNGHGDWSKTGIATDAEGILTPGAADSGDATYTFEADDEGTITLSFLNTHAEDVIVTVNDSVNNITSVSASRTFAENAFVISSTDSLLDDVIAGRDHSFEVAMYTKEPGAGVCSIATNYNVASVKAWVTRDADMLNGAAPQLRNSAATSTPTLPDSEPGSTNLNLPFVSGVATVTLRTTDVGKYSLQLLDDGLTFSDQDIAGGSNTLAVRPFGFDVAVAGNPATTSAAGTRFTPAGQSFNVTVTAKAWSATDDDNDDGIPDGHNDTTPSATDADLSDNATTSSFGSETVPESITIAAVLFDPSPANDPGLSGISVTSPLSAGAITYSAVYNEVGIINISASVTSGNYLSAGIAETAKSQSWSSYVGRFYPDHFVADSVDFTAFCTVSTDFTYMGQTGTVAYVLEPKTVSGGDIENYKGGYNKLNLTALSNSFVAVDQAAPTVLTSRVLVSANTPTETTTGLSFSHPLGLDRDTSPDGPYTNLQFGFLPSDSDGVTLLSSALNFDGDNDTTDDTLLIATTESRFGRLRLQDAFGPETANLPVNFVTEYWINNSWLQNTADSCTSIDRNRIGYPSGTISTPTNLNVTVGSGSTTGTYASLDGSNVNFLNGDAGHFFTAPGANNTGTFDVDVDLTTYTWLRHDWNADGSYDEANLPTARFTFGTYKGHDRILYWQEVLQ